MSTPSGQSDSGSDVASDLSPAHDRATIDDDDDAETGLESWVDWVKRCTREAETHMHKLHIEDWARQQRRRKWRWFRKVAGAQHTDWAVRVLWWDPSEHPNLSARRRQCRPKRRWLDDIFNFAKQSAEKWNEPAKASLQRALNPSDALHVLVDLAMTDTWSELEDAYIDYDM